MVLQSLNDFNVTILCGTSEGISGSLPPCLPHWDVFTTNMVLNFLRVDCLHVAMFGRS
jgi:hypothetical protein